MEVVGFTLAFDNLFDSVLNTFLYCSASSDFGSR